MGDLCTVIERTSKSRLTWVHENDRAQIVRSNHQHLKKTNLFITESLLHHVDEENSPK